MTKTTTTQPAAAGYATTLRTLLVKAEALIYSTENARNANQRAGAHDAMTTQHAITAADRANNLYDYVAALAVMAGINPDTAEQDLAR